MAKNIIPREQDFSRWYQDVIAAGQLAEHSPVKGCMVIRPSGYSIWEQMQAYLDRVFKETGHENAYFPLLIPESFITKEAEHVEGFAPELAMVTHAGGKKLEEALVVRPTSETIIGHMYSKWIKSYRDLPVLINQWANVMRWEMRTRLFLRTTEFLWQEGHTAHETYDQAEEETRKMLKVYADFLQDICAIPVITGPKPEHEKFPGAAVTYSVESMMQDNKALQSATSHNLGQNFAKAFEIKYLDRNNEQQFCWTTSWGCTTRMIGALIMVHGDDDGLIIPPKLAPTQVVIVPIFKKEEDRSAVMAHANKIKDELATKLDKLSIKIDDREDMRPGDKFFTWIQKGVPLRIEVGPKDVEKSAGMTVRRDNRDKAPVELKNMAVEVPAILEQIQQDLFAKALSRREENTHSVDSYDEFKKIIKAGGGFIYAHWDGTGETAERIQKETKATVRCTDDARESEEGVCMVTGKPSKGRVLFALSY